MLVNRGGEVVSLHREGRKRGSEKKIDKKRFGQFHKSLELSEIAK